MKFFIVDGKIAERKDIVLSDEYIDMQFRLSQKIWYGYGGIPLFPENINLLEYQSEILNIPFPKEFQNKSELFRLVKRMLNKNKFYRSGHVHLQVIAGKPSIHTLVTCTAFQEFIFPFSEEGLLVNVSKHRKYSLNTINRMSFNSERLWYTALAEIYNTPYQQSIILNEMDMVCEVAFNNLFLITENELVTPSFKSGCHENAIRPFVLEAAGNLGLKVSEKANVTAEELLNADELFYASEVSGIQWILGIGNQRYIHFYSKRINEELNVLLKGKALENSL
jgi:branched-subunit amino acid aminotransferase/4-amino-4-deoxychorismate lyase